MSASQNTFYITTTLPYVNATPHIGFALEIVAADVIARHKSKTAERVFFNTGTDEHGQKIYENALKAGKSPKEYVDIFAAEFKKLIPQLSLMPEITFVRTTDEKHINAATEFWKRCVASGDIYKAQQTILYCVGCELEKQASELVDGRCPLHPTKELIERTEENYFFKFSRYQNQLLELYNRPDPFVEPEGKLKEITSFVSNGLSDFSISRLAEKMPWGIPVPGDDEHVMYVWFDALVNYISTLGWPEESDDSAFQAFWPGVQVAGKDNLRQQSAMWQAMLLSAGLSPSKKILINGFISIDGQKMSKSLGNVISPPEMVERYGSDGTRFILMKLGPFSGDMDVNWDKLDTLYTTFLANSIGNTFSRICTLAKGLDGQKIASTQVLDTHIQQHIAEISSQLDAFNIQSALDEIDAYFSSIESDLSAQTPWKLPTEEKNTLMKAYVARLVAVLPALECFIPTTSRLLKDQLLSNSIEKLKPVFPRLQTA